LDAGLSAAESAALINMYRERLEIPQESISRSAVQGFMTRNSFVMTRKIQAKKSGKDDPKCQLAKARLEQALQFREMLYLGCLPKDHPDVLASPFKEASTSGWSLGIGDRGRGVR
jgi:hypothetical protein